MSKLSVTVIGILCLTGFGVFALARGFDGTLALSVVAGISGVLGITIGKKT
jgi:hypothetical protein